MSSRTTPPSSARWEDRGKPGGSVEPLGDKEVEPKSSGVLEEAKRGGGGGEAEGGVGRVFSKMDCDWLDCLAFRTRAWLRVQVDRYCVWLDRGAAAAEGSSGLAGKHKSRYSWREDGQPSPSGGQSESASAPPPVEPEGQSVESNTF